MCVNFFRKRIIVLFIIVRSEICQQISGEKLTCGKESGRESIHSSLLECNTSRMLDLFIFHSIFLPSLLFYRTFTRPQVSAHNNSSAGLRSTITSLWFYNGSCVRDSYPSFDCRKEHGNRVSSTEAFPSVFLTPCANSLYRHDRAVESLARPFAPTRRGRTSCVHLFHARWNIGTRREHPFLFVKRAKSKKADAEYIF